MSADNYYMIRKDRQGFFVPVMGFASNDEQPHIQANSPRFHEFLDAIEFASQDYAEYGITVHEECYSDEPPILSKRLTTGHYPACPSQYSDKIQQFDCKCETIKQEWDADYRLYAK